ncbi:hypothetical protein ACLB2K_057400 [Fragaria x ananassa]
MQAFPSWLTITLTLLFDTRDPLIGINRGTVSLCTLHRNNKVKHIRNYRVPDILKHVRSAQPSLKNAQQTRIHIWSTQGKACIQVQIKEGKTVHVGAEDINVVIFIKSEIKAAVVIVPEYFNGGQIEVTKDAAAIAGLDDAQRKEINEPTSAAITYGLDKKGGETNILIFDLSGGTFDVNILTIEFGVFEVARNGDIPLGGELIYQSIMEYFIKLVKHISKDNSALEAEAKRALLVDIESLFDKCDSAEPLKSEEFNLFRTRQVVFAVVENAVLYINWHERGRLCLQVVENDGKLIVVNFTSL